MKNQKPKKPLANRKPQEKYKFNSVRELLRALEIQKREVQKIWKCSIRTVTNKLNEPMTMDALQILQLSELTGFSNQIIIDLCMGKSIELEIKTVAA